MILLWKSAVPRCRIVSYPEGLSSPLRVRERIRNLACSLRIQSRRVCRFEVGLEWSWCDGGWIAREKRQRRFNTKAIFISLISYQSWKILRYIQSTYDMCRIEYITLYTVIQIVLLNPSEHRVYMSVVCTYYMYIYIFIYLYIYIYMYICIWRVVGSREVIADLCWCACVVSDCVCVYVCTYVCTNDIDVRNTVCNCAES